MSTTGDAVELLRYHNTDRQKVDEFLRRAEDMSRTARESARVVWQVTGAGDSMQGLAAELETVIAEAIRINEQLQQQALEVITALQS